MDKVYFLQFGDGDPANFTGLTPTFTVFSMNGLTALAAPGITETPVSSGFYRFQYANGSTLAVVFKADGGAALASSNRYITGTLDPLSVIDQRIGTLTDTFGTTAIDPGSLLGYARRGMEFQEGDADYQKSTGIWSISNRGATTLLRKKTLGNNATEATKE